MMTYDELDRRCTRLSQINYGYRKQADAMRACIAELDDALWKIKDSLINYEPEFAADHVKTIEMIVDEALEQKP